MICVTIGRGRHSSLLEEWKQAAEAGVELVELRIDCLRRDADLKRILKDRPTPVVFTIRRGEGKLMYLAGSESGAAVWVNDIAPEDAAARLRAGLS